MVTGIDPVRDGSELARLGITAPGDPPLGLLAIDAYAERGFELKQMVQLAQTEVRSIGTTWSRKLGTSKSRPVFLIDFDGAR